MENSKLVELIRALNTKELKRLALFLDSPYHNSGPRAVLLKRLFEVIRDGELDQQQIFSDLYPDLPFVEGRVEKLMSLLVNLVQQFIQHEQLSQADRPQMSLKLSKFFREKGLEKRFLLNLNQMQAQLSRNPVQSLEHNYLQFQLEYERSIFQATKNQRSDDLNLLKSIKAFDHYYLLGKLSHIVTILAQTVHASLDITRAMRVVEELDLDELCADFPDDAHLQALLEAYKILSKYPSENAEKEFLALRSILKEKSASIPANAMQMLHTILRNYAISNYTKGNQDYLQISFELYQQHLELGYLYYDGKLTPSVLKNIVTIGLRCQAYDWIEQFLEAHQHKITGTEFPEDIYNFNLANLYFHQKNYEQAINLLGDKYSDLYFNTAARRLEIMIYYELNSPLLEPKMEAFKIYIFRLAKTKLPQKRKDLNNHFLDLLRQFIHPKTYKNQERIQKLYEKLDGMDVVAERDWLKGVLLRAGAVE